MILEIGKLSVKVNVALTVPYGKTNAVEQVFYFCANKQCFNKAPKWCNVMCPQEFTRGDGINQEDVDNFFS